MSSTNNESQLLAEKATEFDKLLKPEKFFKKKFRNFSQHFTTKTIFYDGKKLTR